MSIPALENEKMQGSAMAWCLRERKAHRPVIYTRLTVFLRTLYKVSLEDCLSSSAIWVQEFFDKERERAKEKLARKRKQETKVVRQATKDAVAGMLRVSSLRWVQSRRRSCLPLTASDLAFKLERFYGKHEPSFISDMRSSFCRMN